MPRVDIVGIEDNPTIQLDSGRRLVLAIEDAGIDILHRCGGNARCTTCSIEVLSGDAGPMSAVESARLAREDLGGRNIRLSCQVDKILTDLSIRVLNRLSTSGLEDPGPRPEEW